MGLVSVAVAVALWVVSSLSLTVINALNRTFGVAETRSFVRLRLTALALTLLLAAVLLGSLVAIVAWPQILQRALGLDPARVHGLAGDGRAGGVPSSSRFSRASP